MSGGSKVACPKCGNHVATGAGASSAHCFSCGEAFSLGGTPTFPAAGGSSGSNMGILAAVVGGVVVMVVLAGLALLLFIPVAVDQKTQPPAPVVEGSGTDQAGAASTEASDIPQVSDTQRRLADSVPAGVRAQITQMWAEMRGTTDRTVIAPKDSVVRKSTDSMLRGIEGREITRMAALFSLDEEAVSAVIAVYEAEKAAAEQAAAEQAENASAP